MIGAGVPERTLVLTTFDAWTFAQGGSCLETLRKLMDMGYRLKAVDKLHAKVVLFGRTMVVGSQNLTAGGTGNKEASLRIVDQAASEALRALVATWRTGAKPISCSMLNSMEAHISSLRGEVEDLRRRVEKIDSDLRPGPTVRAGRGRVAIAIGNSDRSLESAVLTYTKRGAGRVVPTLLNPSFDLTEWHFDNLAKPSEKLDLRKRYLLVLEDGRMGWTALNARCPGVVEVSRRSNRSFKLGRLQCRYSGITFVEDHRKGGQQVEFDMSDVASGQEAQIRARFFVEGLDDIKVVGSSGFAKKLQQLNGESAAEFKDALVGVLLRPFRYTTNGVGQGIVEFTAATGGKFTLSLHRLSGHVFFHLVPGDGSG